MKTDLAKDAVTATPADINLIAVHFNNPDAIITINLIMVAVALAVGLLVWFVLKRPGGTNINKIKLKLPFGTGEVEITPNYQEKLIAHKIWTELVTRKAAIPFKKGYGDHLYRIYR